MEEITYQFHWLSFTVHAEKQEAFVFHELILEDVFGKLFPIGRGGRGYKEIFHTPLEVKYYFSPEDPNQLHFHVEIPGKACEALLPKHFIAINELLEGNFKDKYKYCRADLAFDHLNFSPADVLQAFIDEKVRTLAKRESLERHESPFKGKDDGTIGTCTVQFGSNESERMVRVYNKRGYTRLEFQTRDSRAQVVTNEILGVNDSDKWFPLALAHLRDYVDFDTDWWKEFVGSVARANLKVSDPKDLTMVKLLSWVDHQVAPALSVIQDTQIPELMDSLINRGRKRRGDRYNLILGAYQKEKEAIDERAS